MILEDELENPIDCKVSENLEDIGLLTLSQKIVLYWIPFDAILYFSS